MTENETKLKGLYHEVSKRIDEWMEVHKGETFDLDLVCRQLELTSAEARKHAATKLNSLIGKSLDKDNRVYRYKDTSICVIDWVNAEQNDGIDISWPYGVYDYSHFGFDGNIRIPKRGIIVLAGVSNVGKTTFAQNFLWMNMDEHECTYMGNEIEPSAFKRRVSHMDWANPVTEDGKSKFELVERYKDWQDIIRPDGINIIDWINLNDQFYQIGKIIEQIKENLRDGIALICIQKDAGKEMGMGGAWGEHLASLYLLMDFGRLTVRKAKEWNGHNPNKEMYGFDIINHGTAFNNIRKVQLCRKCWGKSSGNYKCPECGGLGYVDSEEG